MFCSSHTPSPFFGLKDKKEASQILFPELICKNTWETKGTFSPDGTLFIYTVQWLYSGGTLMYVKLENGEWTTPEITPFSGEYGGVDPIFSPDGKKLYFTSRRPIGEKDTTRDDTNLWYVEVSGHTFGTAKALHHSLNTADNEFHTSVSNRGTIFFHTKNESSNSMDIYKATWKDDQYLVEPLDTVINTSHGEFDVYISPDEDYLIFSSNRPGGFGSTDLYISFYEKGQWQAPINLGDKINTSNSEYAPCLSSGILTYASNRMLEPWSSENKKDYQTLMQKINSFDNQTNNIWWINIDVNDYR